MERESNLKNLKRDDEFKYRNPYSNNYDEPQVRRKRENSEAEELKKPNPMDDAKSPEHIKLLEESFPNNIGANSFQSDEDLVRVKRTVLQ